MAAGLVLDVLGAVVERAERGDRRHEHPHRMGVVVEAVDEPLAHVLVDVRVMGDLVTPRRELLSGRQLAVQQQVRHLEIGRLLGELLDRVAAITQNSGAAIEVGDLGLA